MTTSEIEAYEAMLAHHRELGEQVAARVAALRAAVDARRPFEPAGAALVAYLADEVLTHAGAEEQSIYPSAARREELRAQIAEMIAEHGRLAELVDALASAADPAAAIERAEEIAALFASHVAKENEAILPVLLADETADLVDLLAQMHRLTSARGGTRAQDEGVGAEGELLALVLEAGEELARAGCGDRACGLVASAWVAVRGSRPDLAARTTAALHRLVRLATAEPVPFPTTGRAAAHDAELDVRPLPPARRHELIFATYEALGPGSGFLLINDHDPKPLRYQFEAEHKGEFTWDYLEAGPALWRVRIGRASAVSL